MLRHGSRGKQVDRTPLQSRSQRRANWCKLNSWVLQKPEGEVVGFVRHGLAVRVGSDRGSYRQSTWIGSIVFILFFSPFNPVGCLAFRASGECDICWFTRVGFGPCDYSGGVSDFVLWQADALGDKHFAYGVVFVAGRSGRVFYRWLIVAAFLE